MEYFRYVYRFFLAREGGDGEEKQDETEENDDAGCERRGGYRAMNHPRQDLGIPPGGTDTLVEPARIRIRPVVNGGSWFAVRRCFRGARAAKGEIYCRIDPAGKQNFSPRSVSLAEKHRLFVTTCHFFYYSKIQIFHVKWRRTFHTQKKETKKELFHLPLALSFDESL